MNSFLRLPIPYDTGLLRIRQKKGAENVWVNLKLVLKETP